MKRIVNRYFVAVALLLLGLVGWGAYRWYSSYECFRDPAKEWETTLHHYDSWLASRGEPEAMITVPGLGVAVEQYRSIRRTAEAALIEHSGGRQAGYDWQHQLPSFENMKRMVGTPGWSIIVISRDAYMLKRIDHILNTNHYQVPSPDLLVEIEARAFEMEALRSQWRYERELKRIRQREEERLARLRHAIREDRQSWALLPSRDVRARLLAAYGFQKAQVAAGTPVPDRLIDGFANLVVGDQYEQASEMERELVREVVKLAFEQELAIPPQEDRFSNILSLAERVAADEVRK